MFDERLLIFIWRSQRCVCLCWKRGEREMTFTATRVTFQTGTTWEVAAWSALSGLYGSGWAGWHGLYLCFPDLLGWKQTLCGRDDAVGCAVCSWSLSCGRSPSLSDRLLNALGWMLLGEKAWNHAWFCIALEHFSSCGGVASPLHCSGAAEDSLALQDQCKAKQCGLAFPEYWICRVPTSS